MSTASANQVDYKEFEEIVNAMMTEFNVPGLAVGIVNKNQILYTKGFGVRGVQDDLPVTSDTQFAIGSTSKAFTATALGLLVDRKTVEWDLPIKSNYLPDFQLMDSSATNLVTIRDLLTHRTGLPRHDLVWYGTPLTREEIYKRLRYLGPTAGVREKTQYQNMMFMTAGYLVEQVTNTTWEDFVNTNIFSEIGMTNSNFSVIDMQASANFAFPHSIVEGKAQQIPFRNIDAIGPAGSINSSVNDMGKWLQLQLNNGKYNSKQIINSNTLAEIHKPQMVSNILGFDKKFSEFGTEHYSMAWFEQTYLGKKLVHHGGGTDGFITFVGFLPKYDRGIVIFGNTGNLVPYFAAFAYMDLLITGKASPWIDRLRQLVNRPSKPNEIIATTIQKPAKSYFGIYSHPAYGEIRISKSESLEELKFAHYTVNYKLAHKSNSSFLPVLPNGKLNANEAPVTFNLDDSGEVIELLFKADEVADPVRFVKSQRLFEIIPFPFNYEEKETVLPKAIQALPSL